MNKLVVYLIALISGVIGVFAFSPFDYWPLAYVSLLGLLYVAKNPKKSTALLATPKITDRNRRNLLCPLWSQFDLQDKNSLPLLAAPLVRCQKQAMR